MSDLFKSAFGYFSNNTTNTVENDFVGQIVEIGSVQLRIKKTIAEGGFAFVFVAQALDSGKEYALKRLLAADEEARQIIIQEINILKKLSGHPNIIQFVAATSVDKSQTGHGMGEFLLLTELCTGGSLVSVLQRLNGRGLPPDVVTKILWQCCKAVHHMHSQSPPVIHRDLKVENLLIGGDNKIRLCDFGSATSQVFRPDNSWSSQQRSMLEDKIFKCTTPMYRAPEMVDTWANNEIGVASDLWALGCLVFLLCFNKHPFEDSSNLRIINANYCIPQADSRYKGFHGIINGCLNVQPNARLTIVQVLDRLAALSETLGINPAESIDFASLVPSNPIPVPTGNSNISPVHQMHSTPPSGNSRSQSPAQRPPGYTQPAPTPPVPSSGGGLFSSIKGGAGSFLKNLKDTSTKVVQSVSQTMVKSEEMAASYITSRICVVNYTEGPDTLQDLRFTIESRHTLPNSAIYNLSSAPLPTHRFPNATIVECGWGKKCPSLQALYTLCEHMHHFLSSQPSNVLFIVCNDGKRSSPLLIAGFLLFVGFVTRPNDALQLYAVKRTPHNLQPSHIRYLEYFTQVLANPLPTLSCNKIRIMNIIMEPVPLFNKNRDGCRPYVDIFQGEDKVFTTIDEYDRMVTFNISHGRVVLPVRCSVAGDITIVVNHARQVLTRITPIPVLRFQFNSAFTHDSVMMLSRGDLDEIEPEHFHDRFLVTINAEEAGDPFVTISPWAKHRPLSSSVLFSSKQEADEVTESFVPKGKPPNQRPPPPRPVPPRPPPVSRPQPLQENSTQGEATDLLNLGFNSETPACSVPPSKPSAVETDDLLNLSFDSAPATVPVFNNAPDPGIAFPSDAPFFSDTPAPTSNDKGLSDNVLIMIRDKKTAKAMMDCLRSTFEKKGMKSQVALQKKWRRMEYTGNTSLNEFFLEFECICAEVKTAGGKIDDSEMINQLLVAMPEEFDGVISALDILCNDEEDSTRISLEYVKNRLLAEEERLKKNHHGGSSSSDHHHAFSSGGGSGWKKF
ncbi:hypothetical protein GE061_017111 [Apolygus lucorum]|uniref:Protein kinase domain-containing protein n=1 Tax=Apolygus lucorum TaxID=248454 RepID=A0A8S9XI34_APOLU|nr:hypothetical protein GE061_017111 [Apolygus lucorum]